MNSPEYRLAVARSSVIDYAQLRHLIHLYRLSNCINL